MNLATGNSPVAVSYVFSAFKIPSLMMFRALPEDTASPVTHLIVALSRILFLVADKLPR